MRIFVYEHTCANPDWSKLPESLRREGRAMLAAVVADVDRIPGVETWTLLAADFPESFGQVEQRHDPANPSAFLELTRAADYTLAIAPETDGLLADCARQIDQVAGHSLGCNLRSIELTGDKLELARHWQNAGIPTPTTDLWPGRDDGMTPPYVLKPRHGAGSQDMHLYREKWRRLPTFQKEMVWQPFLPGQPASVAFLIGPGQCLPLIPATQRHSDDGCFTYLGGSLPLPEPLAARAVALGTRAVNCVPGLRGYVGVDLILGDAEDASQDRAIEINPRLTTSYVGLRRLAEDNLAAALLRIVQGQETTVRWRAERVEFDATG